MALPKGVQIFIDDEDITYFLTGHKLYDPSPNDLGWKEINISNYANMPGVHTIKVTCTQGSGRVDTKVKIR